MHEWMETRTHIMCQWDQESKHCNHRESKVKPNTSTCILFISIISHFRNSITQGSGTAVFHFLANYWSSCQGQLVSDFSSNEKPITID